MNNQDTRKNEIKFRTRIPEEMHNKFLAEPVLKTWKEDFVDEDNGEVVQIERNEVLFEKGLLIDREIAAQIQFHIQAKDILDVLVSNQRREAFEVKQRFLQPYMANANIGGKNSKLLLYARDVDNCLEILRDFIELNYASNFAIVGLKVYDNCIFLYDNLKKISDETSDSDEYESTGDDQKKYHKLHVAISADGEHICKQSYIVYTTSIDMALALINNDLQSLENKNVSERIRKGDLSATIRSMKASIEEAGPFNVSKVIPKEFSIVYQDSSDEYISAN